MAGQLNALLDACVLYPAPLRDLFMHLAVADLFRATWTEAIHDEWIRSVLADRPDLSRRQLERTRDLMNIHVRDCLVSGYEHLIPALSLPDPDDRHVLAAAIKCEADVIVTFNLADFPADALEPYGIMAAHPDEFLCRLLRTDSERVCAAVRRQRANLKRPPKSVEELLAVFQQQHLWKTVEVLRHCQGRL